MRLIPVVLFYALCIAGGVLAQTSTPAPQLSELEQLKMENLELKLSDLFRQAQQAAAPLQEQRKELIAKLEAEHPGYKWHESMGQGDPEGLRPIFPPTPPAPTPAPTPNK